MSAAIPKPSACVSRRSMRARTGRLTATDRRNFLRYGETDFRADVARAIGDPDKIAAQKTGLTPRYIRGLKAEEYTPGHEATRRLMSAYAGVERAWARFYAAETDDFDAQARLHRDLQSLS